MTVQTTFERGRAPFRLGRKAIVRDRRTLMARNYLRKLPKPPERFDGTFGVTAWQMYANDRLGDCTCAAIAHMDMAWSAQAKQPITFTDDQVIELYNRVNGGHDDGAVELFVLREVRSNGLAGHKIDAYAAVEPKDLELVRQAAAIFGGLYIGVSLPVSAQDQAVWDDTGDNDPRSQPGSWGGHAVNICRFDPDGPGNVTWGSEKKMTWKFWERYVDEAWALVPEDFASEFFDQEKLEKDLGQVSNINP